MGGAFQCQKRVEDTPIDERNNNPPSIHASIHRIRRQSDRRYSGAEQARAAWRANELPWEPWPRDQFLPKIPEQLKVSAQEHVFSFGLTHALQIVEFDEIRTVTKNFCDVRGSV